MFSSDVKSTKSIMSAGSKQAGKWELIAELTHACFYYRLLQFMKTKTKTKTTSEKIIQLSEIKIIVKKKKKLNQKYNEQWKMVL